MPGYCTTNQVEFFKDKIGFNEDLIILSYNDGDAIDIEIENKIRTQLKEQEIEFIISNETLKRMEVGEYLMNEYRKNVSFEETWVKTVEKPIEELIKLVIKNNTDIVIFSLSHDDNVNQRFEKNCNRFINCYFLESKLINFNDIDYYLHNLDRHFNKKANILLAQELFYFLVNNNLIKD